MVDAAALNVAEAQIRALQNIIVVQDKQMRSLDTLTDSES
jgi:hypothetical protein